MNEHAREDLWTLYAELMSKSVQEGKAARRAVEVSEQAERHRGRCLGLREAADELRELIQRHTPPDPLAEPKLDLLQRSGSRP